MVAAQQRGQGRSTGNRQLICVCWCSCYFSDVSATVWHNWLVVEVLIDVLWLADIAMMVLSAIVLDMQEQEALQAVGLQLQHMSSSRNHELLSSRKARSLKKATSHGQMLTLAAQRTATRGESLVPVLARPNHSQHDFLSQAQCA